MDHSYYRDKVSAYADGALESQERELIRRHLEDCAECRTLLQNLFRLSEAIEEESGLKGDEYFERLAARIENRISQPAEKVVDVRGFRWESLWWKVSAAAASVLLVGTIGYYQWKEDEKTPASYTDDLRTAQKSAAVGRDSAAVKEDFELEGGRVGQKTAGKAVDIESRLEKKEESNVPTGPEKDNQTGDVVKKSAAARVNEAPSISSEAPAESKTKDAENKEAASGGTVEKPSAGYIVTDEVAQIEQLKSSLAPIVGQQNTLAQWRIQRDSIQDELGLEIDTLLNSDSVQNNKRAAQAAFRMDQDADSLKAFQELANSWYQIALQTPDKNEKNRAIQFLNWYKGRFPVDSPAVNQQLQQLPK